MKQYNASIFRLRLCDNEGKKPMMRVWVGVKWK